MRGESAAAEVVEAGLAPYGRVGHLLDILIGDIPPLLHNVVAILVCTLAAGVQAGGSGVQQMDDTAVLLCVSLQIVARHALRGLRRPEGTHVREDLGAVRQKLHEQHAKAVQHVVFRSQNDGLLLSFEIEGGIENRFRIVAVRPVVCPLTLSLEAAGDGVVSQHLLVELRGQVLVALHQILDDAVHLNRELPLLVLLLTVEFYKVRIVVAAFLAVLLRPGKGSLDFLMIVNALFHTAENLDLIDGLHAHSQVLLHEGLVNDGSADSHTHGADLQIGFSSHSRGGDSGAAKAEQLLFYIIRDIIYVVLILDLMSVNAEGRQALLRVGSQNGRQVHGSRTLRRVEAPYALDGHGIHIHGLGAIAPAGGNRQGDRYALSLELLLAGCGLGNASDGSVSDDYLYL